MALSEKHPALLAAEATSVNFLVDSYQKSIDSGELYADPFQLQAINELQRVYDGLVTAARQPVMPSQQSRLGRFLSVVGGKSSKPAVVEAPCKGLYLWGGVGRGKTHLVDYFYALLPTEKKIRLHFHRFMQLVHDELKVLDGVADPLHNVAVNISAKADLLVLDEMHVNDITDAMLLGRLFGHLFDMGVVLVTTSNVAPHDLYKTGLQRERFMPAIRSLEEYTRVMQMGGDHDYRLRTLEENGVYHLSGGHLSEQRLQNYFHQLSGVELHEGRKDIIINHRSIPVKMWADGVVWFSFNDLCNSPRATDDYTQIATYFHTVLVSDIPVMGKMMDDAARRFVTMIDEFYDQRVNLVVTAEAGPEDLYNGKRLEFEFQRTASRLREMQSSEYMAEEHHLN